MQCELVGLRVENSSWSKRNALALRCDKFGYLREIVEEKNSFKLDIPYSN